MTRKIKTPGSLNEASPDRKCIKSPIATARRGRSTKAEPGSFPDPRGGRAVARGRKAAGIEEWDLSRLTRHARQDANFHELSEEELGRLVDDLKQNGQRTPIEVDPDGRIIDGHQRARAALALGWKTIRVVVRYDLAGDEAAIERRMILANMNRRQLDQLARVRIVRRRVELDGPADAPGRDERDLRDRIGEMLGMSGRNVQRYLNILGTSMAIQRAHTTGRLSLTQAARVARLDGDVRSRIDEAIRAGGDPAAIVAENLSSPDRVRPDADEAYASFLAAADRAAADLQGRLAEVQGGTDLGAESARLDRVGDLLLALYEHLEARKVAAITLPIGSTAAMVLGDLPDTMSGRQ